MSLRHEAGLDFDTISFGDPSERDFSVIDLTGFLWQFANRSVISDEVQSLPGLL
jgi:hypothetical protein